MPRPTRTTQNHEKVPKASKDSTAKRERSLRACTRCRQRKQKCDNALPDCSNCIKGGVSCEAFPIDVVSRENLMQLYEQLQESTRRNASMQAELDLARIIAPDSLCVFSAILVQQVSSAGHFRDGGLPDSRASPEHTKVQLSMPTSTIGDGQQIDSQTTSGGKAAKSQKADEKLDLRKTIELLELSFPAVVPAISFAVDHFDAKAASGRWRHFLDLVAVPIRELWALLGEETLPSSLSQAQPAKTEMSVKELTSKILSASEMTRVAATLLWILLALVKHRSEELIRMDIVLTCFMQAWQAQPTSDVSSMFSTVPISFRRAYDWVHLQTAITTGRLHIQATTLTSFEGVEAIACKPDWPTFLASLCVEQKRLEYVGLHLFTSPLGSLSDAWHEESVWQLLRSIKEVSDVFTQSMGTFGVSMDAAENTRIALLRQKTGVQVYGMFPKTLFMFCPNERRHCRWLANAAPLVVTALGCLHAAWVGSKWVGDHVGDAVGFADLLAAFVWTLQQQRAHNDLRDDWSDAVQTALLLGEQYAAKWPQCSSIIGTALHQLRAFQHDSTPSARLSTPWVSSVSASVASHPPSSPAHTELRTPHAHEMLDPYATLAPLAPLAPLELPDGQQYRFWSGAEGAAGEAPGVYTSSTFQRSDGGVPLYSPHTATCVGWTGEQLSYTPPRTTAAADAVAALAASDPSAHMPTRMLLYVDEQGNSRA